MYFLKQALPITLFAGACGASSSAILDTSCLPSPTNTNPVDVIVNVVFGIAAAIALLMLVVNGFRYMMARGDPGAVASARSGILYAITGLVVVMAAYSIVAFVIQRVV